MARVESHWMRLAMSIPLTPRSVSLTFLSSNVSKITPDGTSTILGTTGDWPRVGIALDAAGKVYTANSGFDPANNSTRIPFRMTCRRSPPTAPQPLLAAAGVQTDCTSHWMRQAMFIPLTVSRIPCRRSPPTAPQPSLGQPVIIRGGIALDAAGNVYTANYCLG